MVSCHWEIKTSSPFSSDTVGLPLSKALDPRELTQTTVPVTVSNLFQLRKVEWGNRCINVKCTSSTLWGWL